MAVKKITDKNTKVEILQAYEELAKEKAEIKSQLDEALKENKSLPPQTVIKESPKVEPKLETKVEAKTVMTQTTTSIQQKMNSTIENLAKIQLGFGSAANELSEQLTTKASKLGEIRQSVENEVQQLTQLHNLEVSEGILDTLIQSYEDNDKAYQEEYSQRYEILTQEVIRMIKILGKKNNKNIKEPLKNVMIISAELDNEI